jgi:Protein of unknown function (DUF3108)
LIFRLARSSRVAALLLGLLVAIASRELLLAQANSATAAIAPPPTTYQFLEGSNYTYLVEWHYFTAGMATIHVEAAGTEKHVVATADSAGVVNMLYKVRDQFQSAIDPKTFCSLHISKHAEEGSHTRQTEIRFDYARHKSVLEETNLKTNAAKTVENDIPGCVTDVLTGFYYVGSLPLAPGNVYLFPVNDGNKTAIVRAEVEGKEAVKTPTGAYSTIRVRLEATSSALKGKGALWVWYVEDERHTPVQMRAKMSWGTLIFRLQKGEKRG